MKVLIQFFFLYSLPIINHTVHNLCNDLIIMKFYFVLFLSEDFGDVVADVNYLNAGGAAPDYKIFICWHPSEGIKHLFGYFPWWQSQLSLISFFHLTEYDFCSIFVLLSGVEAPILYELLDEDYLRSRIQRDFRSLYQKVNKKMIYLKKGFYLIRPFSL